MDPDLGRFVTSTYYRETLHPWVEAFNKSGKAESYFGRDWVKFRPDLDYARYSGPERYAIAANTSGVSTPRARARMLACSSRRGRGSPARRYSSVSTRAMAPPRR